MVAPEPFSALRTVQAVPVAPATGQYGSQPTLASLHPESFRDANQPTPEVDMAKPETVHVPAQSPQLHRWEDERTGSLSFRQLIDADHAPTSGLIHQLIELFPGDGEALHTHDVAQTIFVVEGHGRVELDGRSVALNPGDTVYVPPHTVHGWSAPDQTVKLFCTYPVNRFADVNYHFTEAA